MNIGLILSKDDEIIQKHKYIFESKKIVDFEYEFDHGNGFRKRPKLKPKIFYDEEKLLNDLRAGDKVCIITIMELEFEQGEYIEYDLQRQVMIFEDFKRKLFEKKVIFYSYLENATLKGDLTDSHHNLILGLLFNISCYMKEIEFEYKQNVK